jgi:multidrug resistance protein, MATE family
MWRLREHWRAQGGGREVLSFSYPLILSQMTFIVQMLINRLFLTWYAPQAVAAATAGLFITQIGILICSATGEYTTTFIAQYLGAGRPDRIGPAVWQGIWFAFFAGTLLAALAPAAAAMFEWAGHSRALRADETAYARILLFGSFSIILMPTLASFFAGRGQTRVVLLGNILSASLNVVLDYLLIFGRLGLRRSGVSGAAVATVLSNTIGASFFFVLMIRPACRAEFGTLRGFRFEPRLFLRLLRFGLPAGSHAIGALALALFVLIIGRLGTTELAATGIAFSLNGLVFTPMVGLALGVMALVARYQGSERSDLAERVTWTAFGWSLVWMLFWSFVYAFLPRLLLAPYAAGADSQTFAPVADTTVILLRFVAVFSVFDMMNAIFAAGLRGAGDTAFPLVTEIVVGWTIMLLPTYLACVQFGRGLLTAWTLASLSFCLIGIVMKIRYRAGKWRHLRVIEH